YSISYYGYACKNKTINEIPLDAFKNMFDEIANTCADNSAITVIGKGKGAELALNLANYYPEINNLILYSPSSYNFQSLDSNGKQTYSSWTYNGKPVEYIDFSKNSFIDKSIHFISSKLSFPQSYIGDYEQAIKKANNLESARIKTDSFDGNILMFAGEKDKYWNSSEMASVIYENHPNKDKIEVITYENAGHNFLTDKHYNLVTYGGNYENNFSAHIDSAKIAKEKLALWHPNV
ncbi:MAG: acyl-CoA thioester hydrolase/BAAT C-terminal domain-containing protein, partial [Oscillospiraceae bacterium]